MHIAINTSKNLIVFQELLSLFTNYAQIDVTEIVYNQKEMWVEIPLSRRTFEMKATIFGKQVKYGKERKQAILRVKRIESLEMCAENDILTEQNNIFTALFGLKIDGQRIYLSSAEESQGKPICEIVVHVSDIDIEITDVC